MVLAGVFCASCDKKVVEVLFESSVMGLYDRDYAQESSRGRFGNAPQMRMGFPQITPMVKKLLIINVSVFFVGIIFFDKQIGVLGGGQIIPVNFLEKWFAVFPYSLVAVLQFWRLITYQFLHGGMMHILFNMLGLFFLGPTLERHWGSKRFLLFYLGCGAVGGMFYLLLVGIGWLVVGPMIGASGAILGMLAACAILFPHFVVLFLFFPVPIRVAAIILIVMYSANLILQGHNAGGDAAHLAGMAAGALYVFSTSWRAGLKMKIKTSKNEHRVSFQHELHEELDRILEKVHSSGMHSLTGKEKKILKQATEAEQRRNRL